LVEQRLKIAQEHHQTNYENRSRSEWRFRTHCNT
jgi:hypothetical protein